MDDLSLPRGCSNCDGGAEEVLTFADALNAANRAVKDAQEVVTKADEAVGIAYQVFDDANAAIGKVNSILLKLTLQLQQLK